MEEVTDQVNLDKHLNLLKNILSKQASPSAFAWLEDKINNIFAKESDAIFFMTFSAMPTYFERKKLASSDELTDQAYAIKPHWKLGNWSLDQAARVFLLLNYAKKKPEHFKSAIDKLFSAADIRELIALYQALPLLPNPQQYLLHATNGIRSNMLSVFGSIALNNSYPVDNFDDISWNQVVLKTLFVEGDIDQVVGIKRRANSALARALINTAKERAAAGRPIKPELWYILGLSAKNDDILILLKNLVEDKNPILQKGALLACHYCPLAQAKELINTASEKQEIKDELAQLSAFEKKLVD